MPSHCMMCFIVRFLQLQLQEEEEAVVPIGIPLKFISIMSLSLSFYRISFAPPLTYWSHGNKDLYEWPFRFRNCFGSTTRDHSSIFWWVFFFKLQFEKKIGRPTSGFVSRRILLHFNDAHHIIASGKNCFIRRTARPKSAAAAASIASCQSLTQFFSFLKGNELDIWVVFVSLSR